LKNIKIQLHYSTIKFIFQEINNFSVISNETVVVQAVLKQWHKKVAEKILKKIVKTGVDAEQINEFDSIEIQVDEIESLAFGCMEGSVGIEDPLIISQIINFFEKIRTQNEKSPLIIYR
jgi:hypothetical protein